MEVATHRQPDEFANPPLAAKPQLVRRVLNKAARLAGVTTNVRISHSVPSKAGDLVIFDFRVNHRATPMHKAPERPEDEKIAVFVACSRNTRHVGQYHMYIGSRPDYVYLFRCAIDRQLASAAAAANVTLA